MRVFSNELVLHIRWPEYWSFIFSISPSNESSGLFPLGWKVGSPCCSWDSQESSPTPQFKSINSLMFSFIIQLSHPYMTVLLGNYIILVTSSSLEQMRKPYNSLWLWKESLALGFSFMTGMACLPYQNSRLSCLPRSMCLVSQLCPTLWDPMDCSMPGSSVLHCLLEIARIHVHWVSDISAF